jgi:hypothetical protein
MDRGLHSSDSPTGEKSLHSISESASQTLNFGGAKKQERISHPVLLLQESLKQSCGSSVGIPKTGALENPQNKPIQHTKHYSA